MNQYLTFALLGLGAGALYAGFAQGLVLANRGAGVINLGLGAMAMYVAYTYAGLRDGELMIPPLPNPLVIVPLVAKIWGGSPSIPHWPTFVQLPGGPLPTAAAFVVALSVAALLGLAVHFLVFRWLRYATPLSKTVATVGVLLTLQAIVVLRFGTTSINVSPVLPSTVVHIAGATVPLSSLLLLGVIVVVTVALWAAFKFLKIGIATRAAAENERGAVLIGLSPNRLAAVNWVMSAVIAGAIGILYCPISGLDPTSFILFVVPALGAALLAKFDSFAIAAIAGLLVGVAASLTTPLAASFSWFPQAGAAQALPFIVIIFAMVVRGRSLPERGSLLRIRLPKSPEPSHVKFGLSMFVILSAAGLIFLPYDLRGAILNSLIGTIIALSFVVLTGMAGQISLMQMATAGVAAIIMTRVSGELGWPLPLCMVLSVGAACLFGVLAGLPALRVRGIELAVVTLGAAYAFENLILDNTNYLPPSAGSTGVRPPEFLGFHFGVNQPFPIGSKGTPGASYGLVVLGITVVCCIAVVMIRKSDFGRQLLAIRSNERAAAGLGINVALTKVKVFAVSAGLAGLMGVLTAYEFQGVTASTYATLASISVLAVAYLGGISSMSGAVVAGTLATGGISFRIMERLFHWGQWEDLVVGVGLVLTVLLNPEGIAGAIRSQYDWVQSRVSKLRTRAPGRNDPVKGETQSAEGVLETAGASGAVVEVGA